MFALKEKDEKRKREVESLQTAKGRKGKDQGNIKSENTSP